MGGLGGPIECGKACLALAGALDRVFCGIFIREPVVVLGQILYIEEG